MCFDDEDDEDDNASACCWFGDLGDVLSLLICPAHCQGRNRATFHHLSYVIFHPRVAKQ